MKKMKALINYFDLELKREVIKDEVLEVSEARAEVLLKNNVAEMFNECKKNEKRNMVPKH